MAAMGARTASEPPEAGWQVQGAGPASGVSPRPAPPHDAAPWPSPRHGSPWPWLAGGLVGLAVGAASVVLLMFALSVGGMLLLGSEVGPEVGPEVNSELGSAGGDPELGDSLEEGRVRGDSAVLDDLWDRCTDGDGAACDDLYGRSEYGSEYERYGATCGHRFVEPDLPEYCSDERLG